MELEHYTCPNGKVTTTKRVQNFVPFFGVIVGTTKIRRPPLVGETRFPQPVGFHYVPSSSGKKEITVAVTEGSITVPMCLRTAPHCSFKSDRTLNYVGAGGGFLGIGVGGFFL